MSVLIDLKNASKIYNAGANEVRALDGVSLSVHSGEFMAVMGRSGSGKSTLMNILGCLDSPDKGSYLLNGEDVSRMRERRLSLVRSRQIGFIFQGFNLIPSLTALENVTLPLTFRRIRKRERVKRARVMLKAVGLGNRARHKPSELSGGQQQRVSIARAFINNPQVVFADEPTGNLDTRTTFEMMDLIIGIARERQQTLVIVTHDTEIAQYADQVIHIRDGSIESITERKAIMNQSEIGNEDENKNATDGGNGNEETIV